MADEPAAEEDKLVDHDIEEAATGRRWWLCLALTAVSIGGVWYGIDQHRGSLIVGSMIGVLAFGMTAAGADFVGLRGPSGWSFGVRLPRSYKARTSIRRRGLPRRSGKGPGDPRP